jgi:uncharacterized caspase-like protein
MSVLFLLCVPALAAAQTRRFALVLGSNQAEDVPATPLRYADDDAVAMHELFLEAGVDSVLLATPDDDTRRVHPLTSSLGGPTLERLRAAFNAQNVKMQQARADGSAVEWFFFFSGHGEVRHGEGFLGLERGALTRSVLHEELLARVAADHIHVIIDACKSAFMVGGKGPGGSRLPFAYSLASDAGREENVGFVLSSSSTRDSHEWERFQSGVFSYEVRSALRGGADSDGDGAVSYAELGAFLQTANQGIVNPTFRPDFSILPPGGSSGLGDSVLSWPTTSAATAVTSDRHLGRFYVERSNGERLLDQGSKRP